MLRLDLNGKSNGNEMSKVQVGYKITESAKWESRKTLCCFMLKKPDSNVLSDNKLTSNLMQTFVNLLFYFCNFTLSCQEMQRGVWKQQNSIQSNWCNKHTYSTLASIPLIPAVEQVAILVHCAMITCLIFLSGTALKTNIVGY